MTLLLLNGFDNEDALLRKSGISGSLAVAYEAGRFGHGKAVRAASGSGVLKHSFTASATTYVGFAFKAQAFSTLNGICYLLGDNGTTGHMQLTMTSLGQIVAQRGTTAVATASTRMELNRWHYIEIRAVLHDTTGTYEVLLDGTQIILFTGDTKNGGTAATLDVFQFGGSTLMAPEHAYDDLYIANGLGSINNSFLGEISVRTVTPSGAGNSTQFSPTGSSTNWENVDELPVSGTDYNSSATAGQKDLYALPNVSSGLSIVGVQPVSVVKKAVPLGLGKLGVLARSGGANYTLREIQPTVDFLPYPALMETDPATSSAWTVSGVNALEVGAEVLT